MKRIFVLSYLFFCAHAYSQTPQWVWAQSAGCNHETHGNGVATDTNGDVYITGVSDREMEFSNSVVLDSGGFFIAKYNSVGQIIWAKNAIGSGTGLGVTVDGNHNIYATGGFWDSQFVLDTTVLTNLFPSLTFDYKDVFVVKYNSAGQVIWARSFGGNQDDYGVKIVADIFGNVFVSGYFNSSSIIIGTDTLLNDVPGSHNDFVIKIDSAGNVQWTKNFERAQVGGLLVNNIATDLIGNLFVAGNFSSDSLVISTNITLQDSGNINNGFLAKYDSVGNALWAKNIGICTLQGIRVNNSGEYCIAGSRSSSTLYIDTISLTNSSSLYMVFAAKFNNVDHAVWVKSTTGNTSGFASKVDCDNFGNWYVGGLFAGGSIIFGSDSLYNNLNSMTGAHFGIFVTKYNAAGDVVWSKGANSSGNYGVPNVSIATIDSEVCVSGSFGVSESMGFDGHSIDPYGYVSVFTAKLGNEDYSEIKEFKTKVIFDLLPNPATTSVVLITDEEMIGSAVAITDMAGREMATAQVLDTRFTLPVDVGCGIYFVTINNGRQTATRKLVVER